MPVILVTNDDGISSPGIKVLARSLKPLGDVYVVAPETEQSSVAHALTLHRPLKFEKIKKNTYHINGTPTDCVIIGATRLLPVKPDIIVSGINNGGNLGDDVTYSGTVAAAIEGTLLGIPSIAVSLVRSSSYSSISRMNTARLREAAAFAGKLSSMILKKGLPGDTLLNVNIPNTPRIIGTRITKQGKMVYDSSVQEIADPRQRKYFWIGGGTPRWGVGEETDFEAIQEGYISITPVHLDLTNYSAMEYMKKKWKL
jgi:5'-nucleotidase